MDAATGQINEADDIDIRSEYPQHYQAASRALRAFFRFVRLHSSAAVAERVRQAPPLSVIRDLATGAKRPDPAYSSNATLNAAASAPEVPSGPPEHKRTFTCISL
eukprot:556336-Pleurochrysis_carterae.AAC.1